MTYTYVCHLQNDDPANLLRTQQTNFSMRPQHVRMARDATPLSFDVCLLSREPLRIPV